MGTLSKNVRQLLDEADAVIETLSASEAIALHDDPTVLIVDIRDVRELEREGRIPGSFHAPRGMLEFWIDPESPYHKDALADGRRLLLHCASGWRSALAARTLGEMGVHGVAHIGGGFDAWRKAGGPVESHAARRGQR